jgi:hypothetical protein
VPIELLLLIAFILLPLIQRLLRAAAERAAQGEPQQPAGPPPPARRPATSKPALPSQVALPHVLVVPPAVPATSPAPSMAVPSRAASRSTLDAVIPVSTAHRSLRQRGTRGHLLSPHTVRRAFVLMTILGPCRALAGDDGSEPFSR